MLACLVLATSMTVAGCTRGDRVSDDKSAAEGQAEGSPLDPRERMRTALRKLGHEEQIPEGASLEELEAVIDRQVKNGAIPEQSAEQIKTTLGAAEQRERRMQRLDEELFDPNAK